MPKFIEFRDSLPKTDSGKIRRAELVEEVQSHTGTSPLSRAAAEG